MATTRPFAYNTGSTISGTIQIGNLAIGVENEDYSTELGGVIWWMGVDEDLGYVIAHTTPAGNQPNPVLPNAYVGFWRSKLLTEESFVNLCNVIPPRQGQTPFTSGDEAKTWLNNNGYWTSYVSINPTPTQTPTNTVTPTNTQTPTNTVTPTLSLTPTVTQTPSVTPTISIGVTFSQLFTNGASPGTTIENAWTTFRSQLTGTYTTFTFTSSLVGATSYTVTDAVKVQSLATNLKNGTVVSETIGANTWLIGCCACRSGGADPLAVEFSNVASCSASSTAALRPWINNLNWGGIGSTVGAATQTLTLTFF